MSWRVSIEQCQLIREGEKALNESKKIEFINGIRGIAILMVVWHHWYAKSFADNLPSFLDPLVMAGHYGVQIFFVLSGFVLYLPYAQSERTFETRRYLIKRSLRLLPLYYIALIVSAYLSNAGGNPFDPVYLFVLFPNPEIIGPPFNFPLWSISAEIWFSVAFPAIIFFRRSLATLLVVSALLALACHLGPEWLQMSIFGFLYLFVLGMLTASFAGRVQSPLWPVAIAFVGFYLPDPFGRPLVGLATCCLILHCYTHRNAQVTRFFEVGIIQTFGMMCFSIYVWHEPVRSITGGYNAFSPIQLVNWALLSILAVLSYRFIEFWHVNNWRTLFPLKIVHP